MKATVKIVGCTLANEEHASCSRSYAHVFHRPNTICISDSMLDLPDNYVAGILLHELGHISLKEFEDHTEADADAEGGFLAGVKIYRRMYRGKARLEFVRTKDLVKAFRVIYKKTDW